MSRDLPPLNWVRAFEAAARHESFQRAGAELGVSAGAVSQMVKSLEGRLGVALFERQPRGVVLTDKVRAYGDEITPLLDRLAGATDRIAAATPAAGIRIASLPALAERWLTPRLSGFQENHPGISVEVSVTPDVRRLADHSFDLAIHYEDAVLPDFETRPLFRDVMFPVCSPGYATAQRIETTDDLTGCRLLYDLQWADDWSLWFREAGLPADAGHRESGFALYSMAVEAAVAGLGVVMGHAALVTRDLAAGRLTAPVRGRISVPHHYAAVVPKDLRRRRAVAPFLDWLTDEAGAERAGK